MEKLNELHDLAAWDLIVVDTPPSRSALDFLDAPARMTAFLDGALLRLLLKPTTIAGKGYLKVMGIGATAFMRVAGQVTGMELLDDLATFFRNFDGMYDGFKHRAEAVARLLHAPSSQFVVVASPQQPSLREARFFLQRLEQEGLHLAGVVVNRLHEDPSPGVTVDDLYRAADLIDPASGRDQRAVAAALRLAAVIKATAARERHDVATGLRHGQRSLVAVANQASDVHDLAGLAIIAEALTT